MIFSLEVRNKTTVRTIKIANLGIVGDGKEPLSVLWFMHT